MGIEVVEVQREASGPDWDSFVGSQADGSFYHCHGWKRLNEQHFGHSTVYLEARGGWMIRDRRSAPGADAQPDIRAHPVLDALRQLRRPDCGRFRDDGPADQGCAEHASRLRADYLELRGAAPIDTDLQVSMQKISMTLDLAADPEQVWTGSVPSIGRLFVAFTRMV